MYPVPSRIVFLLAWHCLYNFLLAAFEFFIYSHTTPSKYSSFLCLFSMYFWPGHAFRFHIVEGRCKVHIDVGIDYANGIILIFWTYLQYVYLEFFIKYLNADSIALMQTREISQLILKNGFRVFHIDEFCLMGLQFDHVPYIPISFLHICDQCDCGWGSWFWKFKHFKHPIGDIAQSFLSYKFKDSAVGHFGSILEAEDHRVFVSTAYHEMKFIQCRGGKQDLISLLDVLAKGEGCGVDSQPEQLMNNSRKKLPFGAVGLFPCPGLAVLTLFPPMMPPIILIMLIYL